MTRISHVANHLFFAYGSNMNPGQIISRCFKAEACAIARLPGHEIAFYGHSKRWDGGEATVTPKTGKGVWGIVYKLTLSDSERLDSWQDVRLDGTGAYFHYPTVVMGMEGNEYPVLLYKRFLSGEPGSPSEEYMDAVISGALFHGLPSDYVEELKGIKTVKASFPAPRIFEHERSATFGNNSCDCGGLKKTGSY